MDPSCPYLLSEAINNLNPSEVTFVDSAIKGLSCKCLLMNRAIWVAIKETSELILELTNTFNRFGHQGPG